MNKYAFETDYGIVEENISLDRALYLAENNQNGKITVFECGEWRTIWNSKTDL